MPTDPFQHVRAEIVGLSELRNEKNESIGGDIGLAARHDASPRIAPWVWILAALTLVTWWRAFGTYFAQDDFRRLLAAAGVDYTPPWAPRFLSLNLYFRVVTGLVGPNAVVFHAVGIAFFLVAGLLFFRTLARYLRPGPAAAAAALWLTSPAVFVALHWTSAVNDLLSALFLSGCVLLLVDDRPPEGLRWVVPVLFGLALASKEIAVGAAPVLAILDWKRHGNMGRLRAALYAGLAAAEIALTLGPLGAGRMDAYGMRPSALLDNLPAYLAASVFASAAAHSTSDLAWSRSLWVLGTGWSMLALWFALLIWRRSAGAWLGALWFVGLLAPVLPLERQFYFYYSLCALPGLYTSAFLLACERGWGSHARVLPIACVLLVTAQVAAVQLRHASQLGGAPIPTDFVMRRAQIARNAMNDLDAQKGKVGPRVVLLGQQPVETAAGGKRTTTRTGYDLDPFWDANVWSALGEGDALRWRAPQIRTVEFQRWLGPEDRDCTVLAFEIDGHLRVLDYATYSGVSPADTAGTLAARLSRADRFMLHRMFPAALAEFEVAARMAPENTAVQLNIGVLQAMMGDTTAAMRAIAAVVDRHPHHHAARYNLGLLLWRTGHQTEARRVWGPLVAESPESDLARTARDMIDAQAR
jgi:hypothetical protein